MQTSHLGCVTEKLICYNKTQTPVVVFSPNKAVGYIYILMLQKNYFPQASKKL